MTDDVTSITDFITMIILETGRKKGEELGEIDSSFNLMDSELFDSLGFIDLVTTIEDRFDVEIDFGEVDPDVFTTLGGLVNSAAQSLRAKE